jgi:TIR domain-containing protein
MADIFLSYAREDTDTAKVLAESLAGHGWSVWWDRKILPGVSFASMIEHELNAAKCVIALWSKASVNSDWCKNEADVACKRGVLVPALLEADVEIPLAFRHLQAADISDFDTGSSRAGMEQLTQAIAALVAQVDVKRETPQKPVSVRRLQWRARTPTRRWVALTVVAALVISAVIISINPPQPSVTIQGRVTDSRGHPVVDAHVTIDATQFEAWSNQDGFFIGRLRDAPSDSILKLNVFHENYKTKILPFSLGNTLIRDTLHITMSTL